MYTRSSPQEVLLGKDVLEICRLYINLQEIALRYGCSPVNLLDISRTSFRKNTSEGLLSVCLTLAGFLDILSSKYGMKANDFW